jgi:SlyX protein
MESRITELEIKLSLGEDHIEELDRTVFRQQRQIDLLQAQIRELYQLIQPGAPSDRGTRATTSRRTTENHLDNDPMLGRSQSPSRFRLLQRPGGALSMPVIAYPAPRPRLLYQPRFISSA